MFSYKKRWSTISGESLNARRLAVNQLVTHAQPICKTYRADSAINSWHTIYQYLEPSVLLCIAELNIAISQYINILFQHYSVCVCMCCVCMWIECTSAHDLKCVNHTDVHMYMYAQYAMVVRIHLLFGEAGWITNTTPSIVRDVSAMLVETTTFFQWLHWVCLEVGAENPLALGYRRSQLGVCAQEHSGGRKEKEEEEEEEEEEQEEQEEEKEEKDHIGFNRSLWSAPRGLLDQSTYICNRSSNLNTSVMIYHRGGKPERAAHNLSCTSRYLGIT